MTEFEIVVNFLKIINYLRIVNYQRRVDVRFVDFVIENKLNTNLRNFKTIFSNLTHKLNKNLIDFSLIFLSLSSLLALL